MYNTFLKDEDNTNWPVINDKCDTRLTRWQYTNDMPLVLSSLITLNDELWRYFFFLRSLIIRKQRLVYHYIAIYKDTHFLLY